MPENVLIGREYLQFGAIGVIEGNTVGALLKLQLEYVHRNFLQHRFGPEAQPPAIEENSSSDHLIAEIRVEQASLKALIDLAQTAHDCSTAYEGCHRN